MKPSKQIMEDASREHHIGQLTPTDLIKFARALPPILALLFVAWTVLKVYPDRVRTSTTGIRSTMQLILEENMYHRV